MSPLPPLAPHQLLVLLVDVSVLLLLALCLGRLAARLGMPAIVGELLAGVVLGPSLLGHVLPDVYYWLFPRDQEQMHLLDGVAQVGVLLLVGIAGAHLDMGLLRRRRATAVRVSLGGLLFPLGLGAAAGAAAPASVIPPGQDRVVFVLFLGVAMCVSSIPVIAKTLSDMNLLHRDVGQLTLMAGMVDDAIGWFLLSVVSAMAVVGLQAGPLARSVALLVGFVVLAAAVGRYVVRWSLRLAARSAEPGPPLTAASSSSSSAR